MDETKNGLAMEIGDDKFVPVPRISAAALEPARELFLNLNRLPSPVWRARLYNALGTSNFPLLMANVINKTLLAQFQETQPVMELLFAKTTRSDFKTSHAVYLDGADSRLQLVRPSGEYVAASLTEGEYTYALQKWGRKIAFTWESMINDDLRALRTIPERFSRGARRTIEWYLTSLFMTTTGWLSTLFTANNGAQSAVATGALSAANLATGLAAMNAYTVPSTGEPIMVRPKYLVVPPALEQTAYSLTEPENLAALVTGLASTSSKTTELVSQYNWIKKFRLQVLVNPWIPIVATSGTIGATAWGLFTDPAEMAPGEMSRLDGVGGPEVFIRAGDQQSLGGNGVDPMAGSFYNDSIEWKVRDVHNAVVLRPQSRYLSNGQ